MILGGSTLTITDSKGASHPVPLFSTSPGQIDYLVPDGTATGTATLTITSVTASVDSIE